jgi:uncharacterized OB-fold protein
MRVSALLAALAAAAVPALAIAADYQPETSTAVSTAPGKGRMVTVVTATATVESVDPATRTVVLKTPDGKTHPTVAGDEVRNFDQIKVGDQVKAKYMESLTLELKKGGKALVGRSDNASMDRAPQGAKPGGVALREVSMTADVVGVDAQKKIVSIRNDRGEVIDLHLNDPEQVKLVKTGDQVEATYTEALAVALEPAAPAKK